MDPHRRSCRAAVCCLVLLFIPLIAVGAPPSETHGRAFFDPALKRTTMLAPVIVTARTSTAAADAVKRAGGLVTSDLWIANAVAANVAASRLEALAADPAVVSVIENKTVKPASNEWNGWTSDLRITKGRYTSGTNYFLTPTHLPGGGFAVVSTGQTTGEIIVVNADGSERWRRPLTTGGPYYTPVMINSDATRFFVAGVYGVIYAFDADGRQLWMNTQNLNSTNYYYAPGVITSTGHLVMVSYYGTIFSFEPVQGTIVWQTSVVARRAEYATAAIIGPDNTMYVSSNQGDIFAVTSSGVRWSVALSGGGGSSTGFSPVLDGTTLYAVSGDKLVAFDAAAGSTRFTFTANAAMLGSPIVGADGTVYVASGLTLYAIASNGQTRWSLASPAGGYVRPPIFSADGTLVHIQGQPPKGKKTAHVITINRVTGAIRSNAQPSALFSTQLVADPDGGILIATDDTSVYRYSADGVETHRIKVHTAISHMSQASETGNILVRLNSTPMELHFIGRLPNAWNGRRDVEPAQRGSGWRLVNNYSVDVGADQIHRRTTSNGSYILGDGVGVAVVDSGVYWDPSTKSVLGASLQHQFQGQADFIDTICNVPTGCTQRSDHAFYDYNTSRDSYGHGTHVAGTISNKLIDEAVSDQTQNINRYIGIAPDAKILSIRVLGADGTGTYETVIKGIQFAVQNRTAYNIRIMNLSLSAYATVPYFVDPLNRAVEQAWLSGIVVLAAAGNTGPFAESITVPGNDPYVITVGAVNSNRTAAYWRDDVVPLWSATGPTFDGFAKPDILAPGSQIVSYMYNGPNGNVPMLVRLHPDYSGSEQLFRMNGTSMATAVASGVVALMLQTNPHLTPDQVKYRLMDSARWSESQQGEPVFNTFQQGMGRVWAPEAVLGTFDPAGRANSDMDIVSDLAHGYETLESLAYHYQGPIRRVLSDDGTSYLYYAIDGSGTAWGFGATNREGKWLDAQTATRMTWGGLRMTWGGGISFTGDAATFASLRMTWGGNRNSWSSLRMTWGGSRYSWGSLRMTWGGGLPWAGGEAWSSLRMTWGGSGDIYPVVRMTWGGSINQGASTSSARWIDDVWYAPAASDLPSPAASGRE